MLLGHTSRDHRVKVRGISPTPGRIREAAYFTSEYEGGYLRQSLTISSQVSHLRVGHPEFLFHLCQLAINDSG